MLNLIRTNLKGKSGVYALCNNRNAKIYIGSTVDLYERLIQHQFYLNKNNHYNKRLQKDWNKHSFSFLILEECEITIIRDREQYYINTLLDSKNKKNFFKLGYNNTNEVNNPLSVNNPILQYDSNYNIIAQYDNMSEACKILNINKSKIVRCINKECLKTNEGYIFSREIDEPRKKYNYKGSSHKNNILGIFNKRKQIIYQYSKDKKNLIKIWNTLITEISKQTNIGQSNIHRCLNNDRYSAGGYYWTRNKIENI